MSHLENNNILHQRQHGFRRARSCETQLIDFTTQLSQHLENGQQIDAIIMDFAKAFDKVAHNRLLLKLKQYGIDGQTHRWVKDFVTGRSQRVIVNRVHSTSVPVQSGVPQGSVIGPALFLIYINDLPDSIQSESRLFADDTIIYRQIHTQQDCLLLQQDLQQLERWEQHWQMSFHPDKCITIRFTRKRHPIIHQYQLHNHTLSTQTNAKYLGVTFSADLRWNTHIKNITTQANRTLGLVHRNSRIGSPTIKQPPTHPPRTHTHSSSHKLHNPACAPVTLSTRQLKTRPMQTIFSQLKDLHYWKKKKKKKKCYSQLPEVYRNYLNIAPRSFR